MDSREQPGEGNPARQIGPSHIANTGYVSGPSGYVATESLLESAYVLLLRFDTCVKQAGVQPITFRWFEAGRSWRYTPDVAVTYHDGSSELVEVKHTRLLHRDHANLVVKFRYAESWARDRNWRFRIVTECDIPEVVVRNLRFLDRYRRPGLRISVEARNQVLSAVRILEPTTPTALLQSLGGTDAESGELLVALWVLIAEGAVMCDLTRRLTMTSRLQLPQADSR